jgi:DNA-directed RNA polymerase specialized sigma24 family protein
MSDPHSFRTTRWSLVSRVRVPGDDTGARKALGELCERSWFPVYAFVRRSGVSPADAEDLTQGFFQHVLSAGLLGKAQKELGRFRSFLLGCLKNYLGNEWQKSQGQRRGGGAPMLQWDALEAEDRYRVEAEALACEDDTLFDRQWAQDVLKIAMERLRQEQADGLKFEALLPALTGGEVSFPALNDGALKVAVHRLRKRYREILRNIVADTVDEAEVDAELAYLAACLRKI